MKRLDLKPLLVAFVLSLALLFTLVSLTLPGGALLLLASLAFFGLACWFYRGIILASGGRKGFFQVLLWTLLLMVIVPNLLMMQMLYVQPEHGGSLSGLFGSASMLFIWIFASPYYFAPAEVFGERFFLLETVISPLGMEGIVISAVFWAAMVISGLFVLHAIVSKRCQLAIQSGPKAIGLAGIGVLAIFCIVGLLLDFQQDGHRISMPLSAVSQQLLQAAASGDVVKTAALLDEGANIHARDESGWDALYNAVYGKNPAIVRLLLERGADPNTREYRSGNRCLDALCGSSLSLSGRSVLERAIWQKNNEIVELLLVHGADTGAADFITVAVSAGAPQILSTLLEAIPDPKVSLLAVKRAAWKEEPELLRILLSAGGNPDAGMHAAVEKRRTDNLRLLVESGGDPNVKDQFDNSPLMSVKRPSRGKEQVLVEIINTLVKAGANVNYFNDSPNMQPGRRSVLMKLASMHSPAAVQLLLEAGADPNHQDSEGGTALMLARDPETVRLFLKAGADVNMKDSRGRTAVDHARIKRREDVLEALTSGRVSTN